jgi:integrase
MSKRSYGSGRLFVYKDKNGRESWYGSWRVGSSRVQRKIGDRRKPGGRSGLTRNQAERELRKRMDNDIVVATADRHTLGEVGEKYVDHLEHVMERKPTTIQDYRGYLKGHLEPFFGDGPIDKIGSSNVESYLKRKRNDGLASKTVQNHLNFLHGLFRYAIKRRWAQMNPVEHVDRPTKNRSPDRRIRFLRVPELEALIRVVPDDMLGRIEGALYLTAAMTGLRQGELLGLKWIDIDWLAGRIRVADNFTRGKVGSPKSHEARSVPMAERVARALELLSQGSAYSSESDLVFCHPETGKPYDPSKMRERFYDAMRTAGMGHRIGRKGGITFHALRHTFGTQMAAKGAPLRNIQEWMGHADSKTTEIYRHFAPDPTNGAQFVERAFSSESKDDEIPRRGDSAGEAGEGFSARGQEAAEGVPAEEKASGEGTTG